jgi:mRNA-degrading endonuclease RelE of RelBE toxin-antitoxin system
VPLRVLDAANLGVSLGEVLEAVSRGYERVHVPVQGSSGVSMVCTAALDALEESFEIMSEHSLGERLRRGEHALRTGDFVSEKELAEELGLAFAPDAGGMVALAAPGATPAGGTAARWRLVTGRPAKDALVGVHERERAELWRFVTGTLLVDPDRCGIELVGDLAPRLLARVAGYRVIYRTDTIQHAVRLIDIHPWTFVHLAR